MSDTFDKTKDLSIEILTPQQAMPEKLLDLYRKRDWDGIQKLEEKARNDQKKLAENIEGMDHPDETGKESDAWIPVETNDGSDLAVSYITGTGTMWRRTQEEKPSDPDVKMQAVVIIGSYSENAWSTSMVGIRFHTWVDIPYNIFKAAVSYVAAKFIVKIMMKPLTLAVKWLAEATSSALIKKSGGRITGRIFMKRAGGILSKVVPGILGPIAFIAVAVGIDYFFEWLLSTYNLRIIIINFDTEHIWKPTSGGGDNQSLGEGVDWEGREIPALQLPGAKFTPPGFVGEMTSKGVKIAHYMTYIYHNDNSTSGFTVTGAVGRLSGTGGSVTEGFNFAYRVEKGVENSMGLQAGTVEAQQYYKDTRNKLTHTKDLEINVSSPGRIIAHSPVIWKEEENKYEMRIMIGEPPSPKA